MSDRLLASVAEAMTMELPECHNAAIEKAARVICERAGYDPDEIGQISHEPMWKAFAKPCRDTIAAYLSALKERGLMRETILYPVENIHWVTNTSWVGLDGRDGDTRALIIRMEQK